MVTNVSFKIKIDSGNAALVENPQEEVIRIMEDLIAKMRRGRTCGSCMDVNGNRVGDWDLDVEEEAEEENPADQYEDGDV